jgi:RNA polymerase sigma factor (sigma-70 family)
VDREQKDELQRLMLRLVDGDRDAFDPLYTALWPVVHRFCARALHGSADADDAAQVALMKIFSRISELDPERSAFAWALGVAAYECKTFRQKSRRRREEPALDDQRAGTEPTPEDHAIARDLETAAMEVLGSLRPVDVEALRALMSGQRPLLPGATFRKRVERALLRLRTAWSSRHGTD